MRRLDQFGLDSRHLQADFDNAMRMPSGSYIVVPEMTLYCCLEREVLVDDGGGEGFAGPVIISVYRQECVENAGEINRGGAEIPAMALADMYLADFFGGV